MFHCSQFMFIARHNGFTTKNIDNISIKLTRMYKFSQQQPISAGLYYKRSHTPHIILQKIVKIAPCMH